MDIMEGELTQRTKRTLQEAHEDAHKKTMEEISDKRKIHVWTSGTFNEWMTEDEFKNFINTAVIHNKDITDFHVLYIR